MSTGGTHRPPKPQGGLAIRHPRALREARGTTLAAEGRREFLLGPADDLWERHAECGVEGVLGQCLVKVPALHKA